VRSVEGEEKSENKDDFWPTMHTNLFLFGEYNPLLFIGDGRGTCCLFYC
jgi:hypothetical protein